MKIWVTALFNKTSRSLQTCSVSLAETDKPVNSQFSSPQSQLDHQFMI